MDTKPEELLRQIVREELEQTWQEKLIASLPEWAAFIEEYRNLPWYIRLWLNIRYYLWDHWRE